MSPSVIVLNVSAYNDALSPLQIHIWNQYTSSNPNAYQFSHRWQFDFEPLHGWQLTGYGYLTSLGYIYLCRQPIHPDPLPLTSTIQ